MIGLGTNSTMLNHLISTKAIQDSSWAYNQGWIGADYSQQIDGSLILGGWDKALTTDQKVALALTIPHPGCNGIVVSVTDMSLNFQNASSSSLLGPSAGKPFNACLDPSSPSLSVSNDIWQNFLNTTGSQEVKAQNGSSRSRGPLSNNPMKILSKDA